MAKRHIEEGSRPICLVVGPLTGNSVGLRDELGSDHVEPSRVVYIGDEGDLLRRRSAVVIELSKADVADFLMADFQWHCLYIQIYLRYSLKSF